MHSPLAIAVLSLGACESPETQSCMDGFARNAEGYCEPLVEEEIPDTGTEDTGTPDTGDTEDPPWERPEPSWTLAEAELELAAALVYGFPDPYTPRDTYLTLFSGRDALCPQDNGYNLSGSFSGCVSENGYLYAGLSIYEGPSAGVHGPFDLLGDCYIVDNQGQLFVGAGNLTMEKDGRPDDPPEIFTMTMAGTWSFEGASNWMAGASTMALWVTLTAEAEGWVLEMNGGFSHSEHQLFFDSLIFDTEACDGEPSGELGLRDPNGYWYTLEFGQDCTGCADLVYGGDRSLGEICPGLASVAQSFSSRLDPGG